ncbi:MAG: GHKL domain-containing protein [Oscillospiraceae bacterium]|nr:GHKL domain-containing protein [Oscillospiraceae bacterium]
MVDLFELSINIFEELMLTAFLTIYFGCKYYDFRKYIGFVATVAIASATITFFNSLYIYEGFLSLAFLLIYTIYALVFLNGDKYTKIFISGFINCILDFTSIFSILCISVLTNQNEYQIFTMSFDRIALIVLSKTLFIIACIILLKFRFNGVMRKKNIAVLILMPIVVEISTIGIMQVFLRYSELKSELLLASISVMAANVITYYIFIKINNDAEREMKIKALEQKEEYDKRHADEVDELYTKVCGIRHDLLHHFTMMKGLLDEGNEKAKEYIQSVTQEQIQQIKTFVKTDNDYFDAIVNAKLAVCEKIGIKVRTRIMNGALSRLNNYEIASLFGNLFDNAIEATQNSRIKRIDLDVQLQQGHLSVFMKNTIDESVLEHNKNLITTKKNKEYHGLGIKNIQKIVDMQNGIINYFEENGYFCCDILL